MPTAPNPQIRLGLGTVVVTMVVMTALDLLGGLANNDGSHVVAVLRPVAVPPLIATTIGWWLFASRATDAADNRPLRLCLRAAACALLVTDTLAMLLPDMKAIGVIGLPAAPALFYLSLIHLRHIARNIGDSRLASHSLWCMIFVPVLILVGIASGAILMLMTMAEANNSLAAIGNGQTPPVAPIAAPHVPSWCLFLAMIPIVSGMLWYFVVLTAAWIRFIRADHAIPMSSRTQDMPLSP